MKNFQGGGVDNMAADGTDTATGGLQTVMPNASRIAWPTLPNPETGTASTTTATATKTGHYWKVPPLTRPPGAREGVKSFIAMGEAEIQTAVDMLGRGTTEPPPNVDELLKPVVYESLGHSMTAEQYEAALAKVETAQTALITMDNKVIKTAITVAAENDRTLRTIKTIVKDLDNILKAVGSGKLTSAQEVTLMKAIAIAVEAVYERVAAVADTNAEIAGDSGDSDSGNGGSGGGSGGDGSGGDGGLGQLIQSLGSMLPMAAMAIAPIAQELLTQDDKKPEEDPANKEGQAPGAPAGPAPAPEDPNAVVPAAPAPGSTGQPAATAPAPGAPATATPAANSPVAQARRPARRQATQVDSTQGGDTAATEEDTDEAIDTSDAAIAQA